jgi:COP9 signalosome complex subunit 4
MSLQSLIALPQKEQAAAFVAFAQQIIARSDTSAVAADVRNLVDTVVNQDAVGLVVGRQVLSDLVKILGDGSVKDAELRKTLVQETLAVIQPRIVSYEEQVTRFVASCIHTLTCFQVNILRFQLADILEAEEEWSEAARVLMGTSLDSGQRYSFAISHHDAYSS